MPYILFIIAASLIKLTYSLSTEIIADEAYYWIWSRDLNFSYYDQGPGVALYIRLFTTIFGENFFAIKFGAFFSSLTTIFFIDKSACLFPLSKKQRWLVLTIVLFTPGLLFGSMLLVHDSVLLMAWSMALYFSLRFVKSGQKDLLALYLIFFALAIGTLAKHTMVFFAIALIIWLLFHPKEYRILKNPHFYSGILLAAAMVSSMLYWNITHNWDNIDAIIHLRSSGGSINANPSPAAYLGGQMIMLTPFWFFLFVLYVFRAIKQKWQKALPLQEEPLRAMKNLLLVNAIILPGFFLILSNLRIIQANWVFASYPAMAIWIGLNFPEQINQRKQKGEYWIYNLGIIFCLVFAFIIIYAETLMSLTGMKIPSKLLPSSKYIGYRQAFSEIEQLRKEKHPQAIIIANKYQDAALASWYLSAKPFVNSFNILQKNHYTYFQKFQPGEDYLLFYIQEKVCEKAPVFILPLLESMFDSVKEYPEREVIVDGRVVKRYIVWYGEGYRKHWSEAFFTHFNPHILAIYSQGLTERPKIDASDKQRQQKLIETIMTYFSRKGDMECSVH